MNLFGNEAISQGKVKLEQAGTPSGVAGVLPHQMAWEDTCTENSVKIRAETGMTLQTKTIRAGEPPEAGRKTRTHTCIRDINICLFKYIYIYINVCIYIYVYIYMGSFLVA